MKFHYIQSVGRLLLNKVASLPIFNPSNEGNIQYNETNKSVYVSTDTRWKKIGSGSWGDLTTTITSGTSANTLEDGYLYPVDTTLNPIILYLDSNPTSGSITSIYDKEKNFSLNACTINGNGNTINGAATISFTTNDTISSFIFDGDEWKVDIGGVSTGSGSTSGSLNFNLIGSLSSMDVADEFVINNISTGFNKKVSLTNWLKNLDINTILTETTSASDTDYHMIWDGSTLKKIKNSNISSSSRININANDIYLDSTDLGSSKGSVFDMYPTVDFITTMDGSCWILPIFPEIWNTLNDIKMDIIYSLNGNDPSKTIRLQVDFWSVSESDTPLTSTPDQTINNDIITSSSNIGKYTVDTLTNISNANIASTIKSFVLKITRDVSEDNYIGDLQIIGIRLYQ